MSPAYLRGSAVRLQSSTAVGVSPRPAIVEQTFLSAGERNFPVPLRATGKSPNPQVGYSLAYSHLRRKSSLGGSAENSPAVHCRETVALVQVPEERLILKRSG